MRTPTFYRCLKCQAVLRLDRVRCICGERNLYVFDPVLGDYILSLVGPEVEATVESKELKRTRKKARANSEEMAKAQKGKGSHGGRKQRSDKGKKRGKRK